METSDQQSLDPEGDEKKSRATRRWRPRLPHPTPEMLRTFVLRAIVAIIVVPGVLAGIGAIIDHRIYGSSNPHFHVQFLPYSALVTAPCVLLRWTYGRGRYHHTLEFAIYLVQTGGVLGAFSSALVAGKESYHTVEHIRELFSVDGLFNQINSKEDVYNWLERLTERVYNNTNEATKSRGRFIGGGLSLLSDIRLRQNRVKSSPCHKSIKELGTTGFVNGCYLQFTKHNEDREPYSPMRFTWTNLPYENYVGTTDMSDVYISTDFNSYPMAGYWTFFPRDASYALNINQLRAMKAAGWIDRQTRLIAMDVAIVAPELNRPLWGVANFNIEITQTGQYIANSPSVSMNLLPDIKIPVSANGTGPDIVQLIRERFFAAGRVRPVDTGVIDTDAPCLVLDGKEYFIPFYLGMLSVAIYTIYFHILALRRNWRSYLQYIFNYTEIFWVVLLTLSAAFRLAADVRTPCSESLVFQSPFVTVRSEQDFYESSVLIRYELQVQSLRWQDARHVLALALFLHLFNFLKFLVHFANLGALVRTLQAAGTELASFSLSFFVIFMAFVTMFYTLFSMQSKEFSSFLRSVSTLWLGMLGEISLTDQLWSVKEWAVPALILFTFISVFVLLTLIVAIISNAHERIKNDEEFRKLRERNLLRQVSQAFNFKPRRSSRVSSANGSAASRRGRLSMKFNSFNGSQQSEHQGDDSMQFRQRIARWQQREKVSASKMPEREEEEEGNSSREPESTV